MTLEQRLYMGDRAREVLDNEAFQQAFDDIERELIEAWKTSPQRDVEGREKLHLSLTLLNKVKSCITTTLETGKLAQLELKHKQSITERLRGAGSMLFNEQ